VFGRASLRGNSSLSELARTRRDQQIVAGGEENVYLETNG
jgi:hypothetical protein